MLNQWCMRCNKNPAVIKITKINKGQYLELALCQECAAEESPYQKQIMEKQNLSALLTNLLKDKLNKEAAGIVEPEESEEASPACPSCGFTLKEVKESFLLGCPDCYTAFEDYMMRLLRKVHGSIHHVGKMPPGFLPEPEAQSAIETEEAPAPIKAASAEPPSREPESLADQLEGLHHQLKQATDKDDFLRAAQLRDEIREVEKNLSQTE